MLSQTPVNTVSLKDILVLWKNTGKLQKWTWALSDPQYKPRTNCLTQIKRLWDRVYTSTFFFPSLINLFYSLSNIHSAMILNWNVAWFNANFGFYFSSTCLSSFCWDNIQKSMDPTQLIKVSKHMVSFERTVSETSIILSVLPRYLCLKSNRQAGKLIMSTWLVGVELSLSQPSFIPISPSEHQLAHTSFGAICRLAFRLCEQYWGLGWRPKTTQKRLISQNGVKKRKKKKCSVEKE